MKRIVSLFLILVLLPACAGAELMAGWVTMLEDGASLEEIVNGFARSEEFKAIVNGMK